MSCHEVLLVTVGYAADGVSFGGTERKGEWNRRLDCSAWNFSSAESPARSYRDAVPLLILSVLRLTDSVEAKIRRTISIQRRWCESHVIFLTLHRLVSNSSRERKIMAQYNQRNPGNGDSCVSNFGELKFNSAKTSILDLAWDAFFNISHLRMQSSVVREHIRNTHTAGVRLCRHARTFHCTRRNFSLQLSNVWWKKLRSYASQLKTILHNL